MDAIVGLHGTTRLGDRWYVAYQADIGTGQSDAVYQVVGDLNYRFNGFDAAFGYRYMRWDPDSSLFNELEFNGFFAGARIRFWPALFPSIATDATRSITLPLGAQYRYGAGVTYQKRKDLTLGAAMQWLYEGNLAIKETGGALSGKVSGKYENFNLTFLTIYANWKLEWSLPCWQSGYRPGSSDLNFRAWQAAHNGLARGLSK